MTNPFLEESLRLIEKRNRWDELKRAHQWITECYQTEDAEIETRHFLGSAVSGFKDGMMILKEFLAEQIPSKETLLARIDAQLEELSK
jgi:hypothetical protein